MTKSIHTPEHEVLISLIRETRIKKGLNQSEVSRKLKKAQSFMSDVETGSRRLDIIQLRTLCNALGTDLTTFVVILENRLSNLKQTL